MERPAKASRRSGESHLQARYKPGAWEGVARCKPGTCVVHARYMHGTSSGKAAGFGGKEHVKSRLSLVDLVDMHGEWGEIIGERDPFDLGGMGFV